MKRGSTTWRAIGPAVLMAFAAAGAHAGFDEDFTGGTLRVDTYHSGTAAEEQITLLEIEDALEAATRERLRGGEGREAEEALRVIRERMKL